MSKPCNEPSRLQSPQPYEDQPGFESNLATLRTLQDEWFNGEGKALNPQGLDWLEAILLDMWVESITKPLLFPMPEGRVFAEWWIGRHDASLEIDVEHRTGYWYLFHLDTRISTDRALPLDDAASWHWVMEQVRGLQG